MVVPLLGTTDKPTVCTGVLQTALQFRYVLAVGCQPEVCGRPLPLTREVLCTVHVCEINTHTGVV